MSMKRTRTAGTTVVATAAVLACTFMFMRARAAQDPAAPQMQMPDLPAGIAATPGCLGVETARFASGKQSIFAWFEDKAAVRKWYYSDMHQGVMEGLAPNFEVDRGPLENVPDGEGPILVIATLTMAAKPRFEEMPQMPISQISIELYKPLPGGAYLGGRLAPETVKVPHMKGYIPPAPTEPAQPNG